MYTVESLTCLLNAEQKLFHKNQTKIYLFSFVFFLDKTPYCNMAQYYQIIQNVDDLKHLNLENCVFMNEDGTPFNSQSVIMTDQL